MRIQQNNRINPRFDWVRSHRRAWLRPNVIAGLTTAAVVIPKAMAYATIAGLSVQVGLNPEVLAVVQRSSLGQALGRARVFFNLELAVAKSGPMAAECRV